MSKLLFSVHCADADTHSKIAHALASTGIVEARADAATPAALREALETPGIDGLYVDLDRQAHELLEVIELMPAPRPTLVFGGSYADAAVLVRAMRLQPLDFLVKHEIGSLPERIEQLAAEAERRTRVQPSAPASTQLHGVLAVAGSKGGVGATFLACELAVALQQLGERAVVVDLNLRFSDASLYFDLRPPYTLADVARKGDALDDTFLSTALAAHAAGVRVLAGPSNPEESALVGPGHVELAVNLLREQFDWVVMDLPSAWDELSLRALNAADQILLVTRVDVPSLQHTKQQLDWLERLGAPADRVRVLVNRYSRGSPFDEKELGAFLGRAPDLLIPADDVAAERCLNEGVLLQVASQGSKLERAVQRLAHLAREWVRGETPAQPARSSLLATMLRRAKGG